MQIVNVFVLKESVDSSPGGGGVGEWGSGKGFRSNSKERRGGGSSVKGQGRTIEN